MILDIIKNILGLDDVSDREKVDMARGETERALAANRAREYERFKKLQVQFEGVEVGEAFAGELFSQEETINLGKERKDLCIYNRPFKSFVVTELYPKLAISPHEWGLMPPTAYLRFNRLASRMYKVRHGEIGGFFSRVYLTNTAQAGCSFTYVIGLSEFAHYGMRGDTTALIEALEILKGYNVKRTLADLYSVIDKNAPKITSAPTPYNVEMTDADYEYSQVLPIGTKAFGIHTRDGSPFRLAYVPDKVATPTEPYISVPANVQEGMEGLDLTAFITLYFASSSAGKTVEIERW